MNRESIVGGRFQIVKKLGGGTFGETYLAENIQQFRHQCVIKQLRPMDVNDKNFEKIKELFEREAKALYELGRHHPQIPSLIAYFEEEGQLYLIQEFIEGHDLSKELTPNKKLSESQTLALLENILEPIAYLHENKAIHRDIKPANLMRRSADGKIFLIDFGAIKELAVTQVINTTGETRAATIIGTPGYMPSEQGAGNPQFASDVYAAGIIGIQAITGLIPQQIEKDPETGELVWQHRADLSPQLAGILATMVCYYHKKRYPSAIEALKAVRELKESHSSVSQHNMLTATVIVPRVFPTEVGSELQLNNVRFEVVTLNASGNIIARQTKTAQYFTEDLGNGVEIEMVSIPGGTFMMGSLPTEKSSRDNERPQHRVKVSSFFMGRYQVTQAQWREVANLAAFDRDLKPNPSYGSGDRFPVEQVSWYDAVEFCQRLSRKTGREYRLPSEAEWEYAARAGTNTPFYFGPTITPDLVNYNGIFTYAFESKGKARGKTTPVGSFPANAFNLYDMHGNVWEWCADAWHENYKEAPADGSAWIGDVNDKGSPVRGGSWYGYPDYCRSACRFLNTRINRHDNLGFRVVWRVKRTG
ncbi:MAG: bifunctional serine/threonine-protein kinase/formylglycine-generating enzyme family protein [Prochloraceae cyanobacterium]|nr:bifunctional serine/threonine-protein kinase/formylglycine-generating enzyme family protein [Prochloraceae cyanobacterium]